MPSHHDHLLHSLLENPAFRSWAEGKRPGDDPLWAEWAATHHNGREVLRQAIDIVQSVPIRDAHLTDDFVNRKVNEALQIARREEQRHENKRKDSLFPMFLSGWNVAASLLIAASLCFALFRIYHNSLPKGNSAGKYESAGQIFREVANTERAFQYVQLPDGSSVVLHRYSTLKYPEPFDSTQREVFLTGEAFFEVTKNPAKPFFVHADELVAKVHGTSFSVRAIAHAAEITVAVKTGKVSVFSERDARVGEYGNNDQPTALLLTCNQQATFERARAKLVRSALKSHVLLNIPIENQEFTYNETPAADVFDTLGKLYGVNISFDRNSLARCSVTATLGDEPLENKLKWLCTILEASYTMTNDSITITGNPCN